MSQQRSETGNNPPRPDSDITYRERVVKLAVLMEELTKRMGELNMKLDKLEDKLDDLQDDGVSKLNEKIHGIDKDLATQKEKVSKLEKMLWLCIGAIATGLIGTIMQLIGVGKTII